ncbi:MAG: preprotein translocase subunit SecG [Oscillospiraceae bacterium]|nr:preprotein translocase subunit SecG [Oscillospiraceae bacterium]MBQ4101487.1 preprotein translocase subunit SecG [Oscillospiraceae bacterium]
MDAISIVCGIVLIITSVLLIISVMMQEGKGKGMNALTGGDSYYENNETRTKEKTLYNISKILVALFFVFSLVATIVLALVK